MEKIVARDGVLCNIPSGKTCNLVVLFSGGFDSNYGKDCS
nr:MAG TPA: PP-loop family [Caudoviricetes sp.]